MLSGEASRWGGIPPYARRELKGLMNTNRKAMIGWMWGADNKRKKVSLLMIVFICVLFGVVASLLAGTSVPPLAMEHRLGQLGMRRSSICDEASQVGDKTMVEEYEKAVGLVWRDLAEENVRQQQAEDDKGGKFEEGQVQQEEKDDNVREAVATEKFSDKRSRWTIILSCSSQGKTSWFGRLGNNIITLASLVTEGYMRQTRFATWRCPHDLLNTSVIEWDKEQDVPLQMYNAKDLYFRAVTDMMQIPKSDLVKKKIPKNANLLPLQLRPLYQRYLHGMMMSEIEGPSTCDKGLFAMSDGVTPTTVQERKSDSLTRTLSQGSGVASLQSRDNTFDAQDDKETKELTEESRAGCRVFDAENNMHRLNEYLVVHLRSGDSFAKPGEEAKFREWTYRPPPVSYFKKIIRRETSKKKVLLVMECEERMIIARELCTWRSDSIEIYSGSLKSDVHLLLEAEALVISHGTFAWSIGLVSTKLRELYCFYGEFIPVDCRFPGVDSHVYSSTRNFLLDWKSTPEQIEEMKAFPEEDIVEI